MPQNKYKRDQNLNNSVPIQGWPGYRTRDKRSGLDPFDSQAEAAQMEGRFLRKLFTLKLRTRNPFYLTLMFIFGVVPFVLLAAIVYTTLQGGESNGWQIAAALPFLIFTAALTVNLVINLVDIGWLIPPFETGEAMPEKQAKPKKKKLPRRRKDYK